MSPSDKAMAVTFALVIVFVLWRSTPKSKRERLRKRTWKNLSKGFVGFPEEHSAGIPTTRRDINVGKWS